MRFNYRYKGEKSERKKRRNEKEEKDKEAGERVTKVEIEECGRKKKNYFHISGFCSMVFYKHLNWFLQPWNIVCSDKYSFLVR